MDEAVKRLAAEMGAIGATRSVAGGLFKQENFAAMYNVPTFTDHLRETFGSFKLIRNCGRYRSVEEKRT